MCFPHEDRSKRDTVSNVLFGLFLVALVVSIAILMTAEMRPSVQYSYHKSELLNWGTK